MSSVPMAAPNKVMFFIDGSNIFWGLKDYRRKVKENVLIDYAKLVDVLAAGRQVRAKYYYCSEPAVVGEKQSKFMDMLRQSGFTVVAKKLKQRGSSRNVEKGVDVALVTGLLSLAWEEGAYDDAVIVGGDADYTEPVEKVKSKGKWVEVVGWRDSFGRDLKRVANKVIYLDDLMDKVKLLLQENTAV